jgi:membrane-associated phospholipid phosphatase
MSAHRAVRGGAILMLAASWLILAPAPAAAQLRPPEDIYQVHPVVDGAIIGASVAATIGIYVFAAGSIDTRCPCDRDEVNPFDRFAVGYHSDTAAVISDFTVGAALLVPVALDWLALRDLGIYAEDLTVYAQAIGITATLMTTAKQLTGRPFPRTYAGDPTLVNSANGYRSFFSGHTSLTFTALGVASFTIGERYHVRLIPWLITAAVGISVAVERVAAGWHFPTDVIAGALVGTAVGVVVPAIHLRRLDIWPTLSMLPDGRGPNLSLSGHWN